MTPAQAKRIIQLELSGRGLAFTKLTATTVSFSDLARGSVIFVTVHGWTPNPQWGDIQRVAFDNGFRVEAKGGIFLGAVRFPPGEFIKEELDARGWTQDDFAEILGRQRSVVSAIVNGKRTLSPEIAKDLGAAFGTSAQLWMNLETAYRLFVESHVDEAV